jgi:starvation-inducible outer membrane lipoprotein
MKYALLVLFLAGCAQVPQNYDPSKMSAEQLKAIASDKNATVSCAKVVGTGGTGVVVFVTLDKSTIPANGAVVVDAECKTTVTLTASPKAASAP